MEMRVELPAGCLARAIDQNGPMECQGWKGLER